MVIILHAYKISAFYTYYNSKFQINPIEARKGEGVFRWTQYLLHIDSSFVFICLLSLSKKSYMRLGEREKGNLTGYFFEKFEWMSEQNMKMTLQFQIFIINTFFSQNETWVCINIWRKNIHSKLLVKSKAQINLISNAKLLCLLIQSIQVCTTNMYCMFLSTLVSHEIQSLM